MGRTGRAAPGGAELCDEATSTSDDRCAPAKAPQAPAALRHDIGDLEVSPGGQETLVGECLDASHPTLRGRVLVRWSAAGAAPIERWLPTLHRLPVRVGDRILLTHPSNGPEPVVIGVIDGFADRPVEPLATKAALELEPDEALQVTDRRGTPLLELCHTAGGPKVRLLSDDVDLEVVGDLRVRARRIAMHADEGELELDARDDVVVRGENIHLN